MDSAPDQVTSRESAAGEPAPRFLVTGARGFVGRHLVPALAAAGAVVDGLDVPLPAGHQDPAWLVLHRRLGGDCALGAEAAARDLAVRLETGRYAGIYHLAGQSSAGASFADPAGTVTANLLGTLELLEALRLLAAARAAPPRLLVVGSAEEYGAAAPRDRPCREEDPVLPISPYGTSKAAATQLCLQYHRCFGLPVIATRSFNHTGPGQDTRFAFPSFAAQLAAIEAGRQEPVLQAGDLTPTRDFLDVRDVAAAYLALMRHGRPGRVYNVCSGSALTIGDGLQILLGACSVAVRVAAVASRQRPADIPYLVGDPTALCRDTGWQRRYDMPDTLRGLLADARRSIA